jgi:hypothetical protein
MVLLTTWELNVFRSLAVRYNALLLGLEVNYGFFVYIYPIMPQCCSTWVNIDLDNSPSGHGWMTWKSICHYLVREVESIVHLKSWKGPYTTVVSIFALLLHILQSSSMTSVSLLGIFRTR